MDDFIVSRIKTRIPQINPDIANGLAVKHMKQTVEYIDSIFMDVSRNFPDGLKYDGAIKCTPEEEFAFGTAKKNSKRMFDIARNDLFLVKFMFSFTNSLGVTLPIVRYAYLPFVTDAGSMYLNGTRYFVSPMLSDTTFSPSEKGVFMRLLRDKLNFERTPHHILIDGVPETIQVTHSLIYHKPTNKNKDLKPLIKAHCSIAHYLFCKFGLTETFKRYAKCVPVVGTAVEINSDTFPSDNWVICSSRNIKPAGYGKMKYMGDSNIRIAIARDKFGAMAKYLVGGFFYVVDHFPSSMMVHWVESVDAWKIIMGNILFGEYPNKGKILDDIRDHMNSLEEYIDNVVADKLAGDGYVCNDIYDLFYIVMMNINEWVRSSNKTINSMYNKELTVLYNVLYEITVAIFKMHFKLKSAAKKGLKDRDVENIMNSQFKPKLIYKITKGHSCVGLESYSGDNKFFGVTTKLVPQKNSNMQSSKKERPSLRDNSKRLHVSVAEVGGFSNLPKNEPSGRSCINPHVQIDPKGKVLRDPGKAQLLDRIQEMLTAKTI